MTEKPPLLFGKDVGVEPATYALFKMKNRQHAGEILETNTELVREGSGTLWETWWVLGIIRELREGGIQPLLLIAEDEDLYLHDIYD